MEFFPLLCLPPEPCRAGLGPGPQGSLQGRTAGGREGQHPLSEAWYGRRNKISAVALFLWGKVTALPSLPKAAFLFSPTLSWTPLRVFMSLGTLLNEPSKALPETCLMLVLGSCFLCFQQEQ